MRDSSEKILERLAAGKHRHGPAGVSEVLLLGVHAEVLIHRRQHVLRRLGIALGECALGVGLANDPAALDRAAGQQPR